MRVTVLLRSLLTGGAESQFAQLSDGLARRGHDVEVVTFFPGGSYWDWLQERGSVRLTSLFDGDPHGSTGARRWSRALPLLRARLIAHRTQALYSTQPVTHLLGWSAQVGLPEVQPVWGVRSMMDWNRKSRAVTALAAGGVSWRVPAAVFNSRVSIKSWRQAGFRPRREVFIPNGVDTQVFRPRPEGRHALRAAWGVREDEVLFGLVARFDHEKDHRGAVRALAQVFPRHPELRVAMIGPDRDVKMEEIRAFAESLRIADRFLWVGARRDLPEVYSALDGTLLSSWAEGFPNTVLESMSCGTPVCSTAAGEAPYIIGENGVVVPPRSADALAEGVERFMGLLDGGKWGVAARHRAQEVFSIERLLQRTEALLADPLGCPLDSEGVPCVDTHP